MKDFEGIGVAPSMKNMIISLHHHRWFGQGCKIIV